MSPSKPPETAYLALGSNLGERVKTLQAAAALLVKLPGISAGTASAIYETSPVGIVNQPDFLNAVLSVQTSLDPGELLDACLWVETRFGRVRRERWGPRTLDIDILVLGERRCATDRLELPHPRIRERPFVLKPWAEIASDFVLEGKTVGFWSKSAGEEGVRRLMLPLMP